MAWHTSSTLTSTDLIILVVPSTFTLMTGILTDIGQGNFMMTNGIILKWC
jgi:hypothetical protein